MWSDNETVIDLLGFRVHADLIRDIITDPSILPVVVGIFGDWGGGKSSIMKMLDESLGSEDHQKTICLYFNGWIFEGYEDAKTALLSSILIQLGEHRRFGPKLKSSVVKLLKRVKWMELAKLGIKDIGIPLAVALASHGAGSIPGTGASIFSRFFGTPKEFHPERSKAAADQDDDASTVNWSELLKKNEAEPELLEIRKFRDDFEHMLLQTAIEHLVVLIDDLDRCLPERIIETLEAIKLFLSVPKTAFVIGADPRIVRHAISTRYVARQLRSEESTQKEEYDLVQDYIEKLIQIPYYLPRLSPAEVETYINLLACQKFLDDEKRKKVLLHWSHRRKSNFYAAYQQGSIAAALHPESLTDQLQKQLAWSAEVAMVLTEGLKGNPRQVKRMLNAMLLRKKLADVATIEIRDEVLAKLMVLEYTHLARFQDLNNWQTQENGRPEKLRALEDAVRNTDGHEIKFPEGLKEWDQSSLRSWVRMQPPLAETDLRDYFWLARDKTSSTLAGVRLVPPIVRRLFDQLVGGNEGQRYIAARESVNLESSEQEMLLEILNEELRRHPNRSSIPDAFMVLVDAGIRNAGKAFLSAVRQAPAANLLPGIANRISQLADTKPALASEAKALLITLAKGGDTTIARAAAVFLKPKGTAN